MTETWFLVLLFVVFGYIMNTLVYYSYCKDSSLSPFLAKILTPMMFVPLLPSIVLSVITLLVIALVLVLTILMGFKTFIEMIESIFSVGGNDDE